MNILITPEIPISLSTRTLILSTRTLIASVHVFIALKNRISLSIRTLILFANALIAFGNFISLSARTLILSARTHIAPENPIRIRAHTLIAYTLPSGIACSPTVPGGDTPCLTAGDAEGRTRGKVISPSDAGGVAQQSYSLQLNESQHICFLLY